MSPNTDVGVFLTDLLQVAAVGGAGHSRLLLGILLSLLLGIRLLLDTPLLLDSTQTETVIQVVKLWQAGSWMRLILQLRASKWNIRDSRVSRKAKGLCDNSRPHVWPGAPCPSQHGSSAAPPSQRDAFPEGQKILGHSSDSFHTQLCV